MRKIIILSAFPIFCSLSVQAQGFYFSGSVGGGIEDKSRHTEYNFQGPQDVAKGNPGKGFISNVAIGYFLGSMVGVEPCAGYMTGRETNETNW
jgi:hypothetical protein